MNRHTGPNHFAPSTSSTRQQLCKIILKSMHKCTCYGPDKLIYDHFDLYLTPLTLIFNLSEKCFRQHFSSSRTTTVQNYFEIHA